MVADKSPRARRAAGTASPPGSTSRPPGVRGGTKPKPLTFVDMFRAEPIERVRLIKEGLPAQLLDELSQSMKMPKGRLLPTLGIAAATVRRKVRESKPLSTGDSGRALGLARLVGQVECMVRDAGRPTGFDAAAWMGRWLEEPIGALGGRRPADLMDTAEGQAIVSNLLARMQSGVYS